MHARLHVPALRLNVARDSFIGCIIGCLILVPLLFVLCIVRMSPLFTALAAEHPSVPFGGLIVAMAVLGAMSLVCLAATVTGDPGILASTHALMEDYREEDEVHYCRSCCTFVVKFDHHCGVIGACIGGRNMWSFISFLGTSALFAAVGASIVVSFLYAQLRGLESLAFSQLSVFVNFTTAVTIGCCLAAIHGGTYAALMCGVYIVHVVRGTDSVARRHPQGRTQPSLPQSWTYRLRRCFVHALTWRSAYAAQAAIDFAVEEKIALIAPA